MMASTSKRVLLGPPEPLRKRATSSSSASCARGDDRRGVRTPPGAIAQTGRRWARGLAPWAAIMETIGALCRGVGDHRDLPVEGADRRGLHDHAPLAVVVGVVGGERGGSQSCDVEGADHVEFEVGQERRPSASGNGVASTRRGLLITTPVALTAIEKTPSDRARRDGGPDRVVVVAVAGDGLTRSPSSATSAADRSASGSRTTTPTPRSPVDERARRRARLRHRRRSQNVHRVSSGAGVATGGGSGAHRCCRQVPASRSITGARTSGRGVDRCGEVADAEPPPCSTSFSHTSSSEPTATIGERRRSSWPRSMRPPPIRSVTVAIASARSLEVLVGPVRHRALEQLRAELDVVEAAAGGVADPADLLLDRRRRELRRVERATCRRGLLGMSCTMSAWRAATESTFLPPPPIMIGGRGRWTGVGVPSQLVDRVVLAGEAERLRRRRGPSG